MAGDDLIEIRGSREADRVAADLEGLGRGLRAEIAKELEKTAPGIQAAVRRGLGVTMPRGGGLAGRLATRARVSARRKSASLGSAGVTVTINGADMDRLDRGEVQHPVFGEPPVVSQRVPAGVITGAVATQDHAVTGHAEAALDHTIESL